MTEFRAINFCQRRQENLSAFRNCIACTLIKSFLFFSLLVNKIFSKTRLPKGIIIGDSRTMELRNTHVPELTTEFRRVILCNTRGIFL